MRAGRALSDVSELAARTYFFICRFAGHLLRSARYSTTRVVQREGLATVRKRRRFYAAPLITLGNLLTKALATGTRVLPVTAWHERERLIWERLRGSPVRVQADGTLDLPFLNGRSLAVVLADPSIGERRRTQAIAPAAAALAHLHHLGFTHGDAMTANVIVDLDASAAHWIDFETIHDPARSPTWQRADDVRALIATCLASTAPEQHGATIDLVVHAYGDPSIVPVIAMQFASVWRRPLAFHLAQAPLAYSEFLEVGRRLQTPQ